MITEIFTTIYVFVEYNVGKMPDLYVQSTLNVLILKRIGPFAYKFGDTLKRNVSQQYMKYPMRYCER